MKLRAIGTLFALFILVAGVTSGCRPLFEAGTLTDDGGRQVDIQVAPERIVSHVPPITETLFALGLGDRLVGVSDYCDYPEEAKEIPSIGDYWNPSVENIVAVEPDLVLTDGHSESIKQLDALGINYLIIDPKSIEDIFRSIEFLGKATGATAAADALISDMRQAIEVVKARVAGLPRVRVIYLIDTTDLSNPWTAGPGSFVDYLISLAGGENAAANAQGAWAQISIEEIIDADPEIIILPGEHGTSFTPVDVLQSNAAWKETTAVKEGRIFIIEGDLVDGFGPRIVQGLDELAKIIHPEASD